MSEEIESGTPAEAPKTFTQADIDRVVSERLARQKSQFADYDDLKGKASKYDEAEAASQSALDKAIARAEKAEKASAAASERANTMALRAAIAAAANAAHAVDADTVALLVDRSTLTVGDDGAVAGATEAVAALLAAKPFLAGPVTPSGGDVVTPAGGDVTPAAAGKLTPGFDGGARPGPKGITAAQLRTMTPRQIADLPPDLVSAALAAAG